MAIGGRVTSAIACNGNSSYVTRSTMSGDILLFLRFFVIMAPSTELGWRIVILRFFFFLFFFFFFHTFCPSCFSESNGPMLMELYYKEDPHVKLCTLVWNGKRWPPFPWKQHKCEKNQSVPNWKKLHRNVNWHLLISSLTLEFSKWLPLPWKQLKYQKF